MEELRLVALSAVGFTVTIGVVYVWVRVGSIAHYRTKAEYERHNTQRRT
jgi:hypothetical protein